jgi:CDGSH-type Zn-finger protein
MNRIVVTENGPLECTGELDLIGPGDTAPAHETHTWLCRCGHSSQKPYCDGSHQTEGFRDETLVDAAAGDPVVQETLRVTLKRDGPLKLEGSCEVVRADGAIIFRGRETALCRCGRSARKPFCDGSHKAAGFKT